MIDRIAGRILLVSGALLLGCSSDGPTSAAGADTRVAVPWARLSGRIAIATGRCGGGPTACESFLYVVDVADRQVRHISTVGEPNHFVQLSWSRGGEGIAYAAFAEARWQLWRIQPDGTGRERIFPADAMTSNPDWSADNRLAYRFNGIHEGEFRRGIFIDGHPFVEGDVPLSRPAWSPDSERLVFSMRDGSDPQVLFRADPPGGLSMRISPPSNGAMEAYSDPAYSPDGQRLVFSLYRQSGASGIAVMAPDGTGLQMLTGGDGGQFPAWSPDSGSILFVRGGDLYVMTAAGEQVERVISFREGAITNADWIP